MDNEAYLQQNKTLKKVLFAMNIILWILGILLIALGGYSLNALKGVSDLVNISLPAGVIVLGVFFVILTFVGCYTAWRERAGGLAIYTILMLLLLICLIGVGGGLFKYRSTVMDKFGDAWEHANDGTRNVTQKLFNCCGWNTTSDMPGRNCLTYDNGTYFVIDFAANPVVNSTAPCRNKIVDFAKEYLYVAACAAMVIGVIEFIAVIVSVFLVVRVCRNPVYERLHSHKDEKRYHSGL